MLGVFLSSGAESTPRPTTPTAQPSGATQPLAPTRRPPAPTPTRPAASPSAVQSAQIVLSGAATRVELSGGLPGASVTLRAVAPEVFAERAGSALAGGVQVRRAAHAEVSSLSADQPVELRISFGLLPEDLEPVAGDATRLRILAYVPDRGGFVALPTTSDARSATTTATRPGDFALALLGASDRPEQYPIEGGRFFAQPGAPGGLGFSVVDDDAAPMETALTALGGTTRLGQPIGGRFVAGGRTVQPFANGVVVWVRELDRAALAPVMDDLHRAGRDADLLARWQLPARQDSAPLASCAGDPSCVAARHLALVDPNRPTNLDGTPIANLDRAALTALRAELMRSPDWLLVNGLPTGIAEFPNSVVLRTQRGALRYWLRDTAAGRRGTITVVNVGEIARDLGVWPVEVVSPELPPRAVQPVGAAALVTAI